MSMKTMKNMDGMHMKESNLITTIPPSMTRTSGIMSTTALATPSLYFAWGGAGRPRSGLITGARSRAKG